jgi:integrase
MLTAKKVERTKTPGRYRCGLVRGLYLQISEGGAKSYVLRFERDGRERMMGLGSASEFSLKEVRERARQARQLLAGGIDPLAAKQANKQTAKLAEARKLTFRQAAEQYFNQHESKWRSVQHREAFLTSLAAFAFPVLGNMDVATIDTPDILRAFERHWTTKAITADRVRSRVERVIDWAIVRGHRPPGTNPARWKGHLDQVLPAPRKVAPIEHHRAVPFQDVPAFMQMLRALQASAARALEFTIMTAARSGEVLGARWDEVDFASRTWVIPANRTKAGREHRIPLAPACIDLLRKLPRESGNPFVFIGSRPRCGLTPTSMIYVMQRHGGAFTIHGFRSSFRDWAGETTAFAHDICEAALAHARGDQTVRAYARGDLFNKRRKLMEAWSRYCMAPPAKVSGDVVPLRG